MKTRLSLIVAATALAALSPTMAGAQSADGTITTTQTQEDDHFPWGLLGLLGLAGLIPRKRNDHIETRTAR